MLYFSIDKSELTGEIKVVYVYAHIYSNMPTDRGQRSHLPPCSEARPLFPCRPVMHSRLGGLQASRQFCLQFQYPHKVLGSQAHTPRFGCLWEFQGSWRQTLYPLSHFTRGEIRVKDPQPKHPFLHSRGRRKDKNTVITPKGFVRSCKQSHSFLWPACLNSQTSTWFRF